MNDNQHAKISINDMNTFTHAQLVTLCRILGIACYAECVNQFGHVMYTMKCLPKQTLCTRLVDFFENNITHSSPIKIDTCHYAPYLARWHITSFAPENYVLINRFSIDNMNCRAMLRKLGMGSPQLVDELVRTLWLTRTGTPFTYADLQLHWIAHVANSSQCTDNNMTYNIKNTCSKILTRVYIPFVKLIETSIK